MTQKRNLVIGCDGTWNEPQQNDGKTVGTNVVKFMQAMKSLKGQQRKQYEKGVGTRAWETLRGGIYGYGLDKRVLGGYRFLCNRFRDHEWERDANRVFILGFSRGAYTARRLAGLIAHSGIPTNPNDVKLGWEMYQGKDADSARKFKQKNRFFNIKIEMVGVWDTVKATNDPDYHDHKLPENVIAGYHAMAIDEKRTLFPVLRWTRDTRVLQVWFAGSHSDIGGGYKKQGLSDIALKWMIFRALGHGLEFKKKYVDDNVNPLAGGKFHDSFKGIWRYLGEKTRQIKKADFIHHSVEERLGLKRLNYQPANLPEQPRYWSPKKHEPETSRRGVLIKAGKNLKGRTH